MSTKRKSVAAITTYEEKQKKRKENPHETQFDWSLVDIDASIKKFHELDQQILQLEEERQQLLKILKSHPQTLVQYSTVNRAEKTKENLQSTNFHNLGADCLKVIFDFAFAKQVIDARIVKQFFEMTTKIREALLNANFILGISNLNYKFDIESMPIFRGLYGLEIVLNSECIGVASKLLKEGSTFTHLIVRNDVFFCPKPKVTSELRTQIKSIQHYGAHGSTKVNFYSEFTSLEHFSCLNYHKMPTLPNTKSLIVTLPEAQYFYLSEEDHQNLELLVTLFPSCKSSPRNFKEESLNEKQFKYYVSVRFNSRSKKPDLMALSQFTVKIFEHVSDSKKPVELPYSISFCGYYREVFEKLEGIQLHMDDIPKFLNSTFKVQQ